MDTMNQFDKMGRPRECHDEVPFSEKDAISQAGSVARELGMPYGQLQGVNYEKEQRMSENERIAAIKKKDRQVKIANGWKPCELCGELFFSENRKRRFCSSACRGEHFAKLNIERNGARKNDTP